MKPQSSGGRVRRMRIRGLTSSGYTGISIFKTHKREDTIGFVLGGPTVGKCERPECVKVSWDERSMERIALLILDNFRIRMVLGTLAGLGLL